MGKRHRQNQRERRAERRELRARINAWHRSLTPEQWAELLEIVPRADGGGDLARHIAFLREHKAPGWELLPG